METPQPLPSNQINFHQVVEFIKANVHQSIKDKYEDEDFKHYVYEAAMEAVYGKKYWVWRNAQKW